MAYLTRDIKESFSGFLAPSAEGIAKVEIDTLRGFAVLAVVWHHCMLEYSVMLSNSDLSKTLIDLVVVTPSALLEPLRMPLFTILSGWVYALRPASKAEAGVFVRGKLRRIILPLMAVSVAMYATHIVFYGSYPELKISGQVTEIYPPDGWKVLVYHFGHLWFLQAIFAIFMFILVVDCLGLMNSVQRWLGWMILLTLLPFLLPSTHIWSLSGAMRLSVFFVFGLGLFRFKSILFQPAVMFCAAGVLVLGMTFHVMSKLHVITLSEWNLRLVHLSVGTCGALCLFSLKLQLRWLAWLGGFSYTIYLYHPLAFEVHRVFDSTFEGAAAGQLVWFVLLFISCVFIPILLDRALANTRYLKTLLLGKKSAVRG